MLASIFDSSAETYDGAFTHSQIGMLQRNRVYKYLLPLLNKHINLLEINCGTGHDAITVSKFVKTVYATDVSQKMIEVAEQKNKNQNVKFDCLDLRLLPHKLNMNYDVLLSNFGGLNCLSAEEIKNFANQIHTHLAPKSKLVLVVMGEKCFIENAWFLLKKDKRLFRRNTVNGVPTTIEGVDFLTYYYSPKELSKFFAQHFIVKKTRPIGFLIPPSYLESFFLNKKMLLKFLNFAEKFLGNFSFLSNYADHFVMVLEKK